LVHHLELSLEKILTAFADDFPLCAHNGLQGVVRAIRVERPLLRHCDAKKPAKLKENRSNSFRIAKNIA
jgi:hypothetical protein